MARRPRLGGADAARAVKAANSAQRAASEGRCGEALDDLVVAVSLHAKDLVGKVVGDRSSYIATRNAQAAIRRHCLVNTTGRGLHGARKRG